MEKNQKTEIIKRLVGYACVCVPILFLIVLTIIFFGWEMLYVWGFSALIAGCVIIGAFLIEDN